MDDDLLLEEVAKAIWEAEEMHTQNAFPGRLAPSDPWEIARKDPRHGTYAAARAAIRVIRNSGARQ